MADDISKMPGSNNLFAIYAEKGQNPLSNFTLYCIYEEKVIFLVIAEAKNFHLEPQRALSCTSFSKGQRF